MSTALQRHGWIQLVLKPTSPTCVDRAVRRIRAHLCRSNDVIVGRDLRADVRVAHPLISRAHLLVRFDQVDGSPSTTAALTGSTSTNRRVPVVDIQDGQRINIGNPDGPALTFEVGRHQVRPDVRP